MNIDGLDLGLIPAGRTLFRRIYDVEYPLMRYNQFYYAYVFSYYPTAVVDAPENAIRTRRAGGVGHLDGMTRKSREKGVLNGISTNRKLWDHRRHAYGRARGYQWLHRLVLFSFFRLS